MIVWAGCKKEDTRMVKISEVFPGRPWVHVVPQLKPVMGIDGVKASDCGKCHTEIYKEWKTSTHSQALHDLQFQSELAKDSSPSWICLNCHIPVQNQRKHVVIGLEEGNFRKPVKVPNPGFDPKMREEGVTCATCHVRLNERGDSVIIGANGNTDPPHLVEIDRKALRNRCQDCHNAEYVLDKDLVCYFQTGKEMEASPHMKESEKYCSNCHMPTIQRSFVTDELEKPIRTSHKHTFPGGGVPKNFGLYEHLPTSGFQSSLEVKLGKEKWNKKEKTLSVNIGITNTNPGHKLPSGDPERHLLFVLEFYSASGKLIADTRWKLGQEWEWWPEAKLLSDNRLLPKESRNVPFAIDLSQLLLEEENPNQYNEGTLVLEVFHVRLTEENARHMKEGYSQANPRYSSKIQELEKHYPFRTQLYRIEKNLKTGKLNQKNWKELLLKAL